jgi:hypothetical protein
MKRLTLLLVLGLAVAFAVGSRTETPPDKSFAVPAVQQPAEQPGVDNAGGPDADGWRWIDSDDAGPGRPTYSWATIANQQGSASGDDNAYSCPLPFTFTYRGTGYSTLYFNTNGSASFSASLGSGPYGSGTAYPNAGLASSTMGLVCRDLYTNAMRWGWSGTAPNRTFIVSWDNTRDYSGMGVYYFQLILTEGGEMLYEYQNVASASAFSCGIQNMSWNVGLNVSYALVHSSYAIRWYIPAPVPIDATCLSLLRPAPGSLKAIGDTATPQATVKNQGSTTYNIQARFKIGSSYNQTATATSVAPGASVNLSFPLWTASVGGALAMSCSTEVSGDADATNDKRTGTVTVMQVDFDHLGANWTPGPGEILNGNHFNVGTFTIPSGQTNTVMPYNGINGSGWLRVSANIVNVQGILNASGRGYGGGGGGENDYLAMAGGYGGLNGSGGNGQNGYWYGGLAAGGGGGGSPNGTGGASSWGAAGRVGTPDSGGRGGNCYSGVGGAGGVGYGAGGGGGGGYSAGAGGGGGGGTGGQNAPAGNNGGNGGGTYFGAGGLGSTGNTPASGGNGGYLVAGGNGDVSTDTTLAIGSGGGGAGSSSNGGYGGGGGGGGAGAAKVSFFATTSATVGASAQIRLQGAQGGQSGGPTFQSYYGGGGGGGGLLFYCPGSVTLNSGAIVDNRGCLLQTPSTTNGGTIKIFYGSLTNNATLTYGRLYLYQFPILNVGCTRLIAPAGLVDSGTSVTPACSVYNFGNQTSSYAVRMKIGTGYNSTASVTGHTAGTALYVTFPAWTALPRGALAVSCSTELAGDVTPSNDKQTGTVTVRVLDAQAVSIIAPTGTVGQGTVIAPQASVRNNGTAQAIFPVTFTITPAYTNTQTCTLAAGASATLTFANWNAPALGTQTTKCTTALSGDLDAGNNLVTGQVTVINPSRPDIAVTIIGIPDTVEYCHTETVAVTVRNLGNQTANPSWWLRFDVLNPDQSHYFDSVLVTAPIAGGGTGVYRFPWHAPTPSNHLLTLTAGYQDTFMQNNVLTKNVVVRSKDLEVTAFSYHPPLPYRIGVMCTLDVTVHNKSEHCFPVIDSVYIYLTVRKPDGSVAFVDTLFLDHAPYCQQIPVLSDHPFAPDTVGYWHVDALAPVLNDNVPANNTRSDSFFVGQAGVPDTGWHQVADVPGGDKNKGVKDGGCLAQNAESMTDGDTAFVYLLKGNGRCEFYKYNTESNVWVAKESIPAIGLSGKKKPVKKGGTMTQAAGKMYAAKGNGTVEWWQYDPALSGTPTYPWTQKLDVPAGVKPVLKEGTGAAAVTIGDTAYVYLLRGAGGSEFLRYNTLSNTWTAMTPAPAGTSGKPYKDGSALTASLDGKTLYAIKGNYNEFFAYSVDSNTWSSKEPLPLTGSSGKKKKIKSGGALAYYPGGYSSEGVYCMKGNNTQEFWKYVADSDKWVQKEDVPVSGSKKVKAGGALVYAPMPGVDQGGDNLYATIGNGTLGFFRYPPTSAPVIGVSGNALSTPKTAPSALHLAIAPNPFTNSSVVRYTLPSAGSADLRLYDVTGTLVTTLASGYHTAGVHSLAAPNSLAKGIYLLKLATATSSSTLKVIVE